MDGEPSIPYVQEPYDSFSNLELRQIGTQLTTANTKLDEVADNTDKTVNRLDLIFADMVGEPTFLASVAEINAAIGALGADIDAAIGLSTTAIVTDVSASIAAQTLSLNTGVLNQTSAINGYFQTIGSKIDTVVDKINITNSTLPLLAGKIDDVKTAINQMDSSLGFKLDDVINKTNNSNILLADIKGLLGGIKTESTATVNRLDQIITKLTQSNNALATIGQSIITGNAAAQVYYDTFYSMIRIVTSGNSLAVKTQ